VHEKGTILFNLLVPATAVSVLLLMTEGGVWKLCPQYFWRFISNLFTVMMFVDENSIDQWMVCSDDGTRTPWS